MRIVISDNKINHEYYEVPDKVAKAIIILLEECGNEESKIMTSESDNDNKREAV